MKKLWILTLVCLAAVWSAGAQGLDIAGVVTGRVSGEPIPGAMVVSRGGQAAITDADGRYTITTARGDVLTFSMLGFRSVERTVDGISPVDVAMDEDVQKLDEVVVIGYGTVRKSHLSGAVGSVGSKELEGDVATSAAAALQGKLPGVSVSANGGGPNDGTTINVRGISSLTNNAPLYVVDGAFGDINMVDPGDIASIEVLKDAAAAAIYGSRAAGGVVLISTKGGRRNTPVKVDLNLFTGVQRMAKKLHVLDGGQYSRFARYYGLAADGFGAEEGAVQFEGRGTDWQDEMFRTASVHKANVSFAGGSRNASFSASGGWLNREGILRNTSHESYNVRVKSDYGIFNNRVSFGETLIVRMSEGVGGSDHELNGLLRFPSVVPVHTEKGWGTSKDINLPNPVALSEIVDRSKRSTRIFLNAYAQAEIVKGLKYKLNLGVRRDHDQRRTYTGVYDLGTFGINEKPDLSESFETFDSWVLEHTLNFDRTFGRHHVSLLAGYSAQEDKLYDLNGSNSDLPEFIYTMTGNVATQHAQSKRSEQGLVSMFGRVMYSWDDRYMLSASIRRDGSSRFKKGHQYGNFPSVSLGWNVHREGFFEPLAGTVGQLKLRVSYGRLGNQEMGSYYPTLSVISGGMNYLQGDNIWFGNLPFVSAVSPDDLTWENTETFNAGADLSFFGGRLDVSGDAYIKNTNDVLLPVPYSSSAGIGGLSIQNAGQVQNRGIEMSATWRGELGKKGNYYIGANFSTASNKVTRIDVGGQGMSIAGYNAHAAGGRGINMFKRGHSMSYFNLIETDGIFRSMEEIENYRDAGGNMIQPGAQVGDVRYKDWNRDGRIDTNDQHDVGSPFPNVTFGFRAGLEWRNFDVSVFIDGVSGNKIFNYTRYCLESGAFNGNLSTTVANSWRPDNQNTDMPRFSKSDGADNKLAFTDRWLEDGSYIRLRTIEAGYTIPTRVTKKVMVERARVYVSMENLVTLTRYSGYSPDLGESSSTGASYNVFSRGIDQGRYPVPRSFCFGIQVNM